MTPRAPLTMRTPARIRDGLRSGRLGELALLQGEGVVEPVRSALRRRRSRPSRRTRCAGPAARRDRRRCRRRPSPSRGSWPAPWRRPPAPRPAARRSPDRPPSGRRWCSSASRERARENRPTACARPSRRSPWRWRRRARTAPSRRRATSPSAARRYSPRRTASRAC